MSGTMNPTGDRPCCELLSNLERECIVLSREYVKYRVQEEEYLAKKEKLKEVAAYVYQKLNDLWFSACHMGESDERRRPISDFVTLTSKAWEADYKNIERDTINERLTKGDGPLTGLLEKIQCSVTFTEAKFRTSMLWDAFCHNKFNSLYNEMMPKLARFSCNYIIQCTGTIIDKTIMVLQTIDENIRRFSETLSNFQPSHFNADHADLVEPLPLVAFSHVVKLLTAELLPPPQASALDLRARDAEVLDATPARRSYPPAPRETTALPSALYRAPYFPTPPAASSPPLPPAEPKRMPFIPQPLIRAANLTPQWPPTPLPPLPNHNFDFPRSETYPSNSAFLPYTRNQPYPFNNHAFNPYLANSPFPPTTIPPTFGFNNFFSGMRNYSAFPGYPSPYDLPAWEMELRARQAELLSGPTLYFNRPSLVSESATKIDVGTEEDNTPAKGGKEAASKRQVPIIRRRRRRKANTDPEYQEGEPVPKIAEVKERKPRKNQMKIEAADLETIKMPELLSNVLTPLA